MLERKTIRVSLGDIPYCDLVGGCCFGCIIACFGGHALVGASKWIVSLRYLPSPRLQHLNPPPVPCGE